MKLQKFYYFCFALISITGIVHAQCPVTAKASATTIQCGDTIKLSAAGTMTDYVIKTDFNTVAKQPGSGWGTTPSATYSNPCGAGPDGSICMWMGDAANVPRRLVTLPFNCVNGAVIKFDMRYAIQGGSSPCEGVDLPGEGVDVQYSIDGGASWTSIQYYSPNGGTDPIMTNWKNYSLSLPPAACTANTLIRWTQESSSGITTDHWGLDNVEIVRPNPAFVYDWQHDVAVPTANPYTPPVAPTVNTTYTIVHTDNAGTTCTAAVAITVSAPTAAISASKTQLCPNETSVLTVVPSLIPVLPSTCGLSATGCQGNQGSVTAGTGTVTGGYTFLGRPLPTGASSCGNVSGTIVGNYDNSGRCQMLFKPSDFGFFKGGQIYSIAFNVSTVVTSTAANSGNFENFTISMGCTSNNSFASASDWQTGLSNVYTPKTLKITGTGWVTVEFDTPFDWEGSSNIILQVCYKTSASTAKLSGDVYKTATAYNSALFANNCNQQGCADVGNQAVYTNRPNIKFGVCYRPVPTINYTWSPATGLSSTTSASPTATVAATTTYNVTVSDANHPGCSVAKSITISTVTPNVSISPATPTVCNTSGSPSVVLTASATAQGTGNSISSYLWTPATGLSSTTASNPTASPAATTTYTVRVTDALGCTTTQAVTVSFCPPATLPVDIIYIRASRTNEDVIINWATAIEKDAKSFSVERSLNGTDFYALGTVAAHGNSSLQNNYKFTDRNPSEGYNYYRLKQVDFSDEIKYSSIVSINIPLNGSVQILKTVWEGDKLNVSINNLSESTGFVASLTDINGRRLYSRQYYIDDKGEQIISIETNTLAQGMYFLLIEDANKIMRQTKIVKL